MPRIDPQQLLKCLSVLLSPNGGIRSKDEVQRLASLMTKFSKKLVSKCIYVSILKATDTDLLVMFMSVGGWDLTYSWLSDGVAAKNWPLVKELVDLLLICPVNIDRLKTNACPKLIKTLSKDSSADEKVRLLACQLVEQWLRVVRGDNDTNSCKTAASATESGVPVTETLQASSSFITKVDLTTNEQDQITNDHLDSATKLKSDTGEDSVDGHLPFHKLTIRDGKKILAEISGDRRTSTETVEESSTSAEEVNHEEEGDEDYREDEGEEEDDDLIKPVKIRRKKLTPSKAKTTKRPAKIPAASKKERDSTDSGGSISSKLSPKQKENLKTAEKKTKADISKAKTNIKNKTVTSSPKAKDVLTKPIEETANSKPKEKLSLSLKNKKKVTSKEKTESKIEIKSKSVVDDNDTLTDKEKETLSKFITPPISKVGKIPKKSSTNKEDKQTEEKYRTLKEDHNDNKTDNKRNFNVKKVEIKRPEKKYSISVEPKRPVPSDSRPKTVKTFNSKFRSTGLEEEVKPPPPRPVQKKVPPPTFSPVLGLPDKKLIKRSSPPPEPHIPEKKLKPDSPQEEKKSLDKVGGIKLIPPKPKPMFLQESDVFMDAMLAANVCKEPRKRKRKGSFSKDSDPKKDASPGGNNSPANSPKRDDNSPSSLKPSFKFYQETLETSTEEEKSESKMDESLEFAEPDDEMGDDQKSMSPTENKRPLRVEGGNSPLKGVLVHLKTKKQKKSVSWNEDELECIKFFELDETERVNVTKNFSDMKMMEREHERENFQIARKLAVDDIMEERTHWRALIPIDIAAPVVAPGKNSQEREIQYAREKTVAPAVYFNKRAIPDSASEPDLEIHATTDPVSIPLDDITGSTDSINDFTSTPWPEPRGLPPTPAPPPPPIQQPPAFQPPPAFQQPFPPMGPYMPGPAPPMPMPPAGDCWRTGDGKVVPMGPEMFPPQGMIPPGMPGPMGPGPMMLPPGVTPEMAFPMGMPGPNPTPEEMAHFGGGFPPMGPSPPHQMFAPPLPPSQNQIPQPGNFQGSGSGSWQGAGGGNWFHDNDQGPPPHHDQGPPAHHNQNNNSGRYQGNNWRGGRGGNRNPDGWGGGNSNSRTPICNNFLKRGFCRNNNCRFRHPR